MCDSLSYFIHFCLRPVTETGCEVVPIMGQRLPLKSTHVRCSLKDTYADTHTRIARDAVRWAVVKMLIIRDAHMV